MDGAFRNGTIEHCFLAFIECIFYFLYIAACLFVYTYLYLKIEFVEFDFWRFLKLRDCLQLNVSKSAVRVSMMPFSPARPHPAWDEVMNSWSFLLPWE